MKPPPYTPKQSRTIEEFPYNFKYYCKKCRKYYYEASNKFTKNYICIHCRDERKKIENQFQEAKKNLMKEECEICGEDIVLDFHHIDKNNTNNNPENFITLCCNCHMAIHRYGLSIQELEGKR